MGTLIEDVKFKNCLLDLLMPKFFFHLNCKVVSDEY